MSTPPTRSARLASPSLPVALITVGTTKFESLTDTLERECAPFCAALLSHGVRRLVAQTGSLAPSFDALRRECARCGIEFESFGLTDPASFKAHVEAASLVISHAGALLPVSFHNSPHTSSLWPHLCSLHQF
jgi:UDP-N-acetylglucosamine transferase subunit ALG13